jgi:cytochrome P450 / NADPH-cytochrome P450 reductase
MSEQYGPIYQLDFFGNKIIYVCSYELVNEVSDEKRFEKLIGRNTSQLRSLVGDALFTVCCILR